MQNGSSVGMCTRCIDIFCAFRTDLYAQSFVINKISASEFLRKFSKSALFVGQNVPVDSTGSQTNPISNSRYNSELDLAKSVFREELTKIEPFFGSIKYLQNMSGNVCEQKLLAKLKNVKQPPENLVQQLPYFTSVVVSVHL